MKNVLQMAISAAAVLAGIFPLACQPAGNRQRQDVPERRSVLRLATTTSLYDAGILDYLKVFFEKKYPVRLDIISCGTGIAIEYGKRGDVDILTLHDLELEEMFVKEKHGIRRQPFAYNYFLIVGPPEDPAGIKNLEPADAFAKIKSEAEKNPERIKFVSRGDNSGTYFRERAIWEKAGFDFRNIQKASRWHIETGRGMGSTLMMADEMLAYTLTDRGTFLAYKCHNLAPLCSEGSQLLNVYSAIAVDPKKHQRINYEMAEKFIEFLISEEGQRLIGEYRVSSSDQQIFIPVHKGTGK